MELQINTLAIHSADLLSGVSWLPPNKQTIQGIHAGKELDVTSKDHIHTT